MKIAITGSRGIARSLQQAFQEHDVCLLSRSTGHDINCVDTWGTEYLDRDVLINCAYDKWAQIQVLEFFYTQWRENPTKAIVTVGSRVVSYRQDQHYWSYQMHKQALQLAHDTMQSTARCRMLIVNPGPTDTDMVRHRDIPKLCPDVVAEKIKTALADPLTRRLDIWL